MVRSCAPACLVWVVWLLMALRWWGMGSSTLLGPEESAGPRLRVGVVLVASGPPFVRHARVLWLSLWVLCLWGCSGWVWGVLVGLLFEICIVDASIL